MPTKKNLNLLIMLILLIVLVSIVFLSIKVYNLNTLNTIYKKQNNFKNNQLNNDINYKNKWYFWPSNWGWKSNSELGNDSWIINNYEGNNPRGVIHDKLFGNYCPYAGTCPYGGWKGCPYGKSCPGPQLPLEQISRIPSLH